MGESAKITEVHLEDLVEKYVWGQYMEDKGLTSIFYRRSNYFMDIKWGFVEFKHETESTERPRDDTSNREKAELYCSEFENRTNDVQQHTLCTSRTTTASTNIELQESYTIGAETNLEVNLGVAAVNAGLNASLSVTKTKGQEFSKEMTWNIDAEISVPAWNKAKASLQVCEYPSVIDFTVKTTVSLPSGKLPVDIRGISDNKIKQTYWIMNLEAIFDENHFESTIVETVKRIRKIKKANGKVREVMETDVVLTTNGVCRNVSWKNVNTTVECEKINKTADISDTEKEACEPVSEEQEYITETTETEVSEPVSEKQVDIADPEKKVCVPVSGETCDEE